MIKASHVESVLQNEIDNHNEVYLYLEGNEWCAYERSAYFLVILDVPVKLRKEIIREGYDVILMKAYFSVKYICLPLAPKTVLKKAADDKLMFQINDIIDGFQEWKQLQISK